MASGSGDQVSFESFERVFSLAPAGQIPGEPWRDPRLVRLDGYLELAVKYAGCTFENGLYRLHDSVTGPQAAGWVATAFPGYEHRACPFGYDWLGRAFCVDSSRIQGGEFLILLVDLEEGECYEIPASFHGFHDDVLVNQSEAALVASLFSEWAAVNPGKIPLKRSECVGYKVPLFLGGEDNPGNQEVTDLDVYWTLTGQLLANTRHLQPGAAITDIRKGDS
jgi:hypothetical protein